MQHTTHDGIHVELTANYVNVITHNPEHTAHKLAAVARAHASGPLRLSNVYRSLYEPRTYTRTYYRVGNMG